MTAKHLPDVGEIVALEEALLAYESLEKAMLCRVFRAEIVAAMGAYDLLCTLEGLAYKRSAEDVAAFRFLRAELRCLIAERTLLANGEDGTRFFLRNNESALEDYDRKHHVRIQIDSKRLMRALDDFLVVLREESKGLDEYADTYSGFALIVDDGTHIDGSEASCSLSR